MWEEEEAGLHQACARELTHASKTGLTISMLFTGRHS